jgi:hypothetical protein
VAIIQTSSRLDKNDKTFNAFNGTPSINSLVNGKLISIVWERGTFNHKNKFEVNFEYSSFVIFFAKTEVIKEILVEVDVAPIQSLASGGLSATDSIYANGGTLTTHHASSADAPAVTTHSTHRTASTNAGAINCSIRWTSTAATNNPNASLASIDAGAINHRTRRQATSIATMESIGTWTPSCSISNNNQPSRTTRPYMAYLPVGVHIF